MKRLITVFLFPGGDYYERGQSIGGGTATDSKGGDGFRRAISQAGGPIAIKRSDQLLSNTVGIKGKSATEKSSAESNTQKEDKTGLIENDCGLTVSREIAISSKVYRGIQREKRKYLTLEKQNHR
ncbi:MAG: hypothetical protein ACOYOS_15090 [Syntrophales bacterium]